MRREVPAVLAAISAGLLILAVLGKTSYKKNILLSDFGRAPPVYFTGPARVPVQQLVFVNDNSFSGYQGLPDGYMQGASWMDGSRGTEHLPRSVLNKLQAREAAAGIQGDEEGYSNYQPGEGLDMSNGGKPAPPVQEW